MLHFMTEKQKKIGSPQDQYYFGGPVPREVQEKIESCRDRGMTAQNIVRKLAYLWIALPAEKQNALYFSSLDVGFDPTDKVIADLLAAVDDIVVGNLLAVLPQSARLVEAFASVQSRGQGLGDKSPPRRRAKSSGAA